MKYAWKIFKYSKICPSNSDFITECGFDLNPLSQTILHSEMEGNQIKQERWLHLYSQTNKTIEVIITDSLDIKLFIYTANEIKTFVLESLSFAEKMKWMAKGRSFACKMNNKKFQISFYDQEEVNSFHKIFSEKINFKMEETKSSKIREEFIKKMKKLNGNLKYKNENIKSFKTYEELKKEFLNLVYFE